MHSRLLAWFPRLTLLLFLGPVAAGLLATLLPAFGILPVLGFVEPSLAPWRALLAAPGLGTALALSLASGLGSTLLALLAAVLIAAAFHGRPALRRIAGLLPPLVAVPHVASAVGFAFLIAPTGLLMRGVALATGQDRPFDLPLVQDPWGIALLVGLALREAPFLLFTVLAALGELHADRQLAAARTLGLGPVEAWLRIVLPQLYGRIRLPVFAVLAFGLSVVDMAAVLGPTTPPTLAVLLFQWFADPDPAMRLQASAGAVLLLGVTIAVLVAWRLGETCLAVGLRPGLVGSPRPLRERCLLLGGVLARWLVLGAGLLGLAALLLFSVSLRWRFPDLVPESLTLQHWQHGLGTLAGPAATSLAVGAGSALLALVLALGCLENERRRPAAPARVLWLAYLPLVVPQIAFLFGFQMVLLALRLDGTITALLWAHLVFVFPYVLLMLRGPYLRLDPRFERAARTLGRGRLASWLKIRLPLLLRPLAAALAVGFGVSIAQYLPTVFAGAGRWPTLTTETLALAVSGDRRLVGVAAVLLSVAPLLAVAAALGLPAWMERRRRRPARLLQAPDPQAASGANRASRSSSLKLRPAVPPPSTPS
ncbi:ABC transporter permease subunit [Geminicoccaceae bacterium 1502E]|nr:ABC transporter permease subunit [Geminicoccaceae bacterium 1502E]